MDRQEHYSEEDFQNYFLGTFEGDQNALETHMSECSSCSESFNAYASIWSFAKSDLKVERLNVDLSRIVVDKVFEVEEKKPVLGWVTYALLICLSIALVYCFNSLIASSIPAYTILLLIPVGLFIWVSLKEISLFERKYASHFRFNI